MRPRVFSLTRRLGRRVSQSAQSLIQDRDLRAAGHVADLVAEIRLRRAMQAKPAPARPESGLDL